MIKKFEWEVADNILQISNIPKLREISNDWVNNTAKCKYTYNFTWLGRPIIQYPQDMVAR